MIALAAADMHKMGHQAIIFRRNFPQLSGAGGLIQKAKQFYEGAEWRWRAGAGRWENEDNGATIDFRHLARDADLDNYQGQEYSKVAFDELTQFDESQYLYLFSRIRSPFPDMRSQIVSTTNPGGRGGCVPYGRVLTPHGWREIQDLRVGDGVYTLTPTGEMVEGRVAQTHAIPYQGKLMRVCARGLNMLVTPDHRVARIGGDRATPGQRFSLTPFKALPGQTTVLRTVEWQGVPLEMFAVPAVPTRRSTVSQPETIKSTLYAALMGWYLSEGCCLNKPGARRFDICQIKPQHRATIRALLTEIGFKFHESPKVFQVHSPAWAAYFEQFGKCRDKFIPPELKNASRPELEALLSALMAGDGNREVNSTGGRYYTTSPRLADDVAEVALKLGYVVSIHSRQRPEYEGLTYAVQFKHTKSGGTELLTGNHTYRVSTQTRRRSDVEEVDFEGMVYCIGVEGTHNFILEQDGSVWVSGNSWVKKRWRAWLDPKYRSVFHWQGREYVFGPAASGELRWFARVNDIDTEVPESYPDAQSRTFISSRVTDNPYLMRDRQYISRLMQLPLLDRKRLLEGDWDIQAEGNIFKAAWFKGKVIPEWQLPQGLKWVRGIDMASTGTATSDETSTAVLAIASDGRIFIRSSWAAHLDWPDQRKEMKRQMLSPREGGITVRNGIEWAATGIPLVQDLQADPDLQSVEIRPITHGNIGKLAHAQLWATRAQQGLVYLVEGDWNDAFLEQAVVFSGEGDSLDDRIDAVSIAYRLAALRSGGSTDYA